MDLQGFPIIYIGNQSFLAYAQINRIPYDGPKKDLFVQPFQDLSHGIHHYFSELPGTFEKSVIYDFSFFIKNINYEHLYVLSDTIIPDEVLSSMNNELLDVLFANQSVISPLNDAQHGM